MVNLKISYDGGNTLTSNLSAVPLHAIDPYYNSASGEAVILLVASFFALILSIPALMWHAKNRNLPAISMVSWVVMYNTFNIINAFIWPSDNIHNWFTGVGYCDVQIKLDIASSIGLLGSLCCILRSLARALDTDNARLMPTPSERQRQLILELLYCIGFPILLAALHFIVQPFRYDVFAIAGCVPSFSNSWLSIIANYMWPPVVCLINAYYAVLLIVRLRRYRRDFSSIISSRSAGGLNKSRFVRLFATALIMLLIIVPLQAYSVYRNLLNPITTFDWRATHNQETWQTVVLVPTFGAVFSDRWVRVGLAFPIFLCFGWGKDAKSLYKSWARLVGLDRLFPSLRSHGGSSSDDDSAANTSPKKKLRLSTLTSSISSTHPLVSKALKLLSFSQSTSKSGDSTDSDVSTSASRAKPSPTFPPGNGNGIDYGIAAQDFASPWQPDDTNSHSDHNYDYAPAGTSIPMTALAARSQKAQAQAQAQQQPKEACKNRPHSLYSLGSLRSSRTFVNSPGFPIDASTGHGYNTARMTDGFAVAGADASPAVGEVGIAVEEEQGWGQRKKKKEEEEGAKEVKRSWETAAQALDRVQRERAYEALVVGALV